MLVQLKLIDQEDALMGVLEKKLSIWHYSGVGYQMEIDSLEFDFVLKYPCLMQLFVNRIIENKNLSLAGHPVFKPYIRAALGNYSLTFWKELKFDNAVHE